MSQPKVDAKIYIEWGGQYDVREVELIEYPAGKFQYEDLTGGHMTLHDHLRTHDSAVAARTELMSFVFRLGEDGTFCDFGPDGIIRSSDPYAYEMRRF